MPNEPMKAPWDARLREAAQHVEDDVRKLIGYINDEVVPDVRRNSSAALRSAALELERLARRMEESASAHPPEPPPPPAA